MSAIMKNALKAICIMSPFVLAAMAGADTVLDEKWTDYKNGDVPKAPWDVKQCVPGDGDSITVQDGFLVYDNGGKGKDPAGKDNWNPELKYSFKPTKEKLNITFTYRIPQNYGAGSQLTFTLLGSNNKAAVYLSLGRNYYYQQGMSFRDEKNEFHPMGHTFTVDETVTIELKNIDLSAKTFDCAWSSSTGEMGKVSDCTFNNSVPDFTTISLGDNTGPDVVSKMFLGPIKIETTK